MTRRRVLAALGTLAVCAGLAFTFVPGLAPGFDLAALLLAGVWLVALAGVAAAAFDRLDAETATSAPLPTASERPSYPIPGDDIAAAVRRVGAGPDDRADRDRIRERVRQVAAEAMTRTDGITEAAARERLDAGDWTDDDVAASLFADEAARSRAHEGVESGFDERVERALAAISDEFDEVIDARDSESGADESAGSTTGTARFSSTPDLDVGEERLERTGRWRGVSALALAATAVGVLAGAPFAIVAGLAGVGFGAYSRLWDAPETTLAVERHVAETAPSPGDRVRVTLSVRNEGDRLLPDLRICDDVPAGLRVVEGTPRHTTALRPGKQTTVSYEVEAVRGAHEFGSVTAIARDVSGASRRVRRIATDETTVVCRPNYGERAVALGDLATQLPGRQPVAATGQGIAFHSVREYRRGDPLGSVDWNRLAKDGELATRRFEQPRTVTAVLVVDARPAAYVTNDTVQRRPGVDACVHAAGALACGLLDAGCRVGLAALSSRDCWRAPGAGNAHRERLLDDLTTHPAFGWAVDPVADREGQGDGGTSDSDADVATSEAAAADRAALTATDGGVEPEGSQIGQGDDESRTFDRLRSRLPSDAQVILVSPFADDPPVRLCRRLDARGHDVIGVSPRIAGGEDAYRRAAALERGLRLDRIRRGGVPVIDWEPPADPTAGAGWSAWR